jgi:uncharacterized protein (TIGR02145 family)
MKKLLFLLLPFFSYSQTWTKSFKRIDDVYSNGYSYRAISIGREDEYYNVIWKDWLIDDIRINQLPYVLDIRTQEGQTGVGNFISEVVDSIYFNPAAALKVCPQGWRLPRIGEWDTLFTQLTYDQRRIFVESFHGYIEHSRSSIGDSIVKHINRIEGGFWWSSTLDGEKVLGVELTQQYRLDHGKGDLWDYASVRCVRDPE